MIYTIKTVAGREDVVLESIAAKAKTYGLNILALIHPEEIKGYIFVEGEIRDIEELVKNIPHVRGVIKTPVEVKEIERFLEPKKVEIKIEVGYVVEVIGGPFKGTRGKVTRYDEAKREVTIEPLEVAVPIPITISVDFIKIVEKKT
jgi:transcriptional antiterminator NusG